MSIIIIIIIIIVITVEIQKQLGHYAFQYSSRVK